MKRIRILSGLVCAAALLSLGSTCVVVEEGDPEEPAYRNESAEEQTMDDQMEEVDEQINR